MGRSELVPFLSRRGDSHLMPLCKSGNPRPAPQRVPIKTSVVRVSDMSNAALIDPFFVMTNPSHGLVGGDEPLHG